MNISSVEPHLFAYDIVFSDEPVVLNARFFIACVAGITAHYGLFIREEWHMKAPVVLALHVLLGLLTASFEIRKLGLSTAPFINTFLLVAGYLIGLFLSIVAYRLSPYHRLYRFPGPRLAAVSKLWHVWQCRDSRNHELMDRLHNAYEGDFVRIGMIQSLGTQALSTVTKWTLQDRVR